MESRLLLFGIQRGATGALERVLKALPLDLSFPVVMGHHRVERADDLLQKLWAICPLPLAEPEDKEELLPGRAYLAPYGYHLLVEKNRCLLSRARLSSHGRPAIDPLFESAAEAFGAGASALLLANNQVDGQAGIARLQAFGARTWVLNGDAPTWEPIQPWLPTTARMSMGNLT